VLSWIPLFHGGWGVSPALVAVSPAAVSPAAVLPAAVLPLVLRVMLPVVVPG
jgi:hypothetical protein